MRKMETNDWIILNNIIYKIHTTECFNDMRYELLDQLKMVLDFDSAYEAMTRLLEKDIPITAVFAISDVMAIGAIRAIRDKGLSVPDDISITGFDGTTLADYYNPKIVSIRQHHKDLAVRSVELLFNMIDLNKPATHEIIPFELTVGESVKKML